MTPLILLTGATGYVGSRLLTRLEREGRRVRCLIRQPARLRHTLAARTEVVQGDCLDETALARALDGVHTAYYLIHSMAERADFQDTDRRAAHLFGLAAARAGVRRIVYLGGLADLTHHLSTHLQSRVETGEALRAGGWPI